MKPPAFQWYPGDCDTDEHVRLMTHAQFGLYVRCLNHAWLNDGLPPDDESIANLFGINSNRSRKWRESFMNDWRIVSEQFPVSSNGDGRRRNKRQEKQRMESIAWREKCAGGGRESGKVRRTKLEVPFEGYLHSSSSSSSSSSSPPIVPPPSDDGLLFGEPEKTEAEAEWLLELRRCAAKIKKRHGSSRGCSLKVVEQKLLTICSKLTEKERAAKCRHIDARHEVWASSWDWTREDGQFKKGLEAWLNPNAERWDDEPLRAPKPSGVPLKDRKPGVQYNEAGYPMRILT